VKPTTFASFSRSIHVLRAVFDFFGTVFDASKGIPMGARNRANAASDVIIG
jgi:hypothetical protein